MLHISSFGYISADSPNRHGCSTFRFIPGLLQVSPNNSNQVYFWFFFKFLLIRKYPTLAGTSASQGESPAPRGAAGSKGWTGGERETGPLTNFSGGGKRSASCNQYDPRMM